MSLRRKKQSKYKETGNNEAKGTAKYGQDAKHSEIRKAASQALDEARKAQIKPGSSSQLAIFAESIKKKLPERDIVLDPWQEEVLSHEGDIVLRSGRQVGKSMVVALKAALFALKYSNVQILIIAASQRQSWHLFSIVKDFLDIANDEALAHHGGYSYDTRYSQRWNAEEERLFNIANGIYASPPTKSEVLLKNGSRVYSLPAGRAGHTIRGLTIDLLIADEAAFIPDPVWLAVRPMLAVSKKKRGLGWEMLLSTPFGKFGYFFEACHDPKFKHFHIPSTKCSRIGYSFLEAERKRLSRLEFAQEYLGDFIDEFQQFFPSQLISNRMTFLEWDYEKDFRPDQASYYLGVDLARYGQDENAYVVVEMDSETKRLKLVYAGIQTRKDTMQTVFRIERFHNRYNLKKIFIDDAGVGAGVTDLLIDRYGRKVVPLNNSHRTVDKEGRKGKIFKEDLYSNALAIMEDPTPKIEIINSILLARSLRSITFEYTSAKNILIKGRYSHLSEAFVRALWCVKSKGLKLFVY